MEPLNNIAQGWLKFALKEIKDKIRKLKIGQSGTLERTVDGSVKKHGPGWKAEIRSRYYGIFPDMGVGRGVPRDEVRLQKQLGGRRKAKRWTREVAHQGHRFGELIGRGMADQATQSVSKSMDKKITMKF